MPLKDEIAEMFYLKLFLEDPEIKPLFKEDIKVQGEKLINSINLVINSLNNLEKVVPTIQELGVRHVDYGVKPEHYDTVGNTLLWALGKGLAEEFTDEVKDAWITAYGLIASTMKEAAYK